MISQISQVQHTDDTQFTKLTPCNYTPSLHCPSRMTSAYKAKEITNKEKFEYYYTSMCLEGKPIRCLHPLDYIHYDLEQTVHLIAPTEGPPNVLAAKVSFVCKIVFESKKSIYEVFDFGLKCRNAQGIRRSLFWFEDMKDAYSHPKDMYACIAHFYEKGRENTNVPKEAVHGASPGYTELDEEGNLKKGQAQLIHHTEQLLVAYLARPETAKELAQKLKEKIRKKYPTAQYAKVYSMGIHFHSVRICCSPCEYALSGIISDKTGIKIDKERLGLYPNMVKQLSKEEFLRPSTRYDFEITCTGTANQETQGHTEPRYAKENDLSTENITLLGKLETTIPQTFLPNLIEACPNSLARERRKSKSLLISGSTKTDDTPIEKINNIKILEAKIRNDDLEIDEVTKKMKKMHLNLNKEQIGKLKKTRTGSKI